MLKTVAVLTVAAVIAFAGCGGDDESSAQNPLCSDLDAVSQSVASLQDLDLSSTSVDDIQADLGNLKDEVSAVSQSAQDVAQADAEQLQAPLQDLEAAIRDIPSNGIDPVQSALTELKETGQQISDDRGCENGS